MSNEKIEMAGLNLGRQLTAQHGEESVNQTYAIRIDSSGLHIDLKGMFSGQVMRVEGADPAIMQHYDELAKKQHILEISQRAELPEPTRLPVGRPPKGFRQCWICEGRQQIEVDDGLFEDCVNCRGTGMVPKGGLVPMPDEMTG